MRARIVALLLLLMLLAAGPVRGVGFLTQKELVGRDGNTLIVLPPYTYVTVIQHFGNYALISYRAGEEVREIHVRSDDLEAARPDEEHVTRTADPDKLLALYRERVPFDVYIDELPAEPPADPSKTTPPDRYRMRIKTRNLLPETVPHVRFEVQVYFDTPHKGTEDLLWQLQILAIEPREFRTVQTPLFSVETLQASAPNAEAAADADKQPRRAKAEPEAETEAEKATPEPPTMRFAVRLFVDEIFIDQKTGVVEQIEEQEDDSLWTIEPDRPGGSSRRRLRIPARPVLSR